ncbi:metalloregulator ArsR/SmtB family transcription factor [Acidihalobacter ferrooxydans]|uniref:Transcriptional regulator n=1 Tax=Acidihalobacter ferrooxydans TaxID=1765967 RepID=A0A1P8UDX6_9GAMM|nr:metalloregulator ArsR/SmtB family transcription factor [Acidihalobacter ferrooxydans]APZ41964.1 transcriptional regulator [Acidihalobacter ferrooxydans]
MTPETFFRALSDGTRLRCLMLLQREGELCVCELTQALDLSQPKISRHLAALREAGVVLDRRAGQWVHYRIHPELPGWAQKVLADTAAGLAQDPVYAQDAAHLHVRVEHREPVCPE